MEPSKIYTPNHGLVHVYEQLMPKKDKAEVTVYFKADESRWRYFRREHEGAVSDKEVDWNTYLLGGRSFRIDMIQPVAWFNYTQQAKVELIDREITDYYTTDDIPGFHVEPVEVDPNYESWSDETLWSLEKYVSNRIGELELELRDLKREHAAMWRVGDRKFKWGDRL